MTTRVKGWCPGALRPMAAADGLIARIRAPLGRITASQATGLAKLAALGDGGWDLTARANLQLRGLSAESHAALLEGLRELGLLDPSPEAESRRNILVSPFWRPEDETPELAPLLEAALREGPPLPAKFGLALDCGPEPVLSRASADLRIERAADGGLILRADGAKAGAPLAPEHLRERLGEALAWFMDSGGAPEGRGRMAAHLARGVALPPCLAPILPPAPAAPEPQLGVYPQGRLIGFAFGRLEAEALAKLGDFRLTPWRAILLEAAEAPPDLPHAIFDPDDPLLRVFACAGAPGCAEAAAPTRGLTRALAPALPPGAQLHVSGCAKGCAHPAPAAFTLRAESGGFALIRHGAASAPALRSGLTPEFLTQNPSLLFESPA